MDEVAAFGNVVINSRLTKKIQMSNFGDVKASYAWDKSQFTQNFTVYPASGYINPNSNLDVEVTFHPKAVDSDCHTKVTCEVKGGETINLSLMGKAVAQDGNDMKELAFSTLVRKPQTQNIKIDNTEDKEWAINPTISSKDSNDFFSGK
jgi:hydrocephalus-inducing protein